MTVSYSAQVATSNFGCFLKLLRRWRGSIYKVMWLDLITFILIYYTLNFTYRYAMSPYGKRLFEGLIHYCHTYSTLIPLSFVLGFYVTIVMKRWWKQYMTVPWPDPIAVYVSALFVGQDDRGRVMRRTMMRYVCLCLTMVLTMVSPCVKKRFPKQEYLVEAGLMTENERDVLRKMDEKSPKHKKHWVPLVWASSIVSRARKEGRIRDDVAQKTIIDQLDKFRNNCQVLLHYDSVPIPLVYTQVVTLAVYSYFLAAIIGQQYTEPIDLKASYNYIHSYFPIFTILEFFFYMGWLKVAELLSHPFDEDDDSFEVNWMIDRNLQVSYLIVDEMHHEHPELVRDQYWDEVLPEELPYPAHLGDVREEPPEHSTAQLDKNNDDDKTMRFVWKRRENANISSFQSSISRMNTVMKRFVSTEGRDSYGRARHSTSSVSDNEAEDFDTMDDKKVVTRYTGPAGRRDWQAELEKYETKSERPSSDRISSPIGSEEEEEEEEEESTIIDEDEEKDDFDKLREERERERQIRQLQRIKENVQAAHSVSTRLTSEDLAITEVARASTSSTRQLRPTQRESELKATQPQSATTTSRRSEKTDDKAEQKKDDKK